MTDDLISREALKRALHNFFDGKVIDEPAYVLRDVFSYIDNAPTVNPTLKLEDITEDDVKRFAMIWQRATSKGLILETDRPRGKWVFVQYDGNPKIGNWHCSECRQITPVDYFGHSIKSKYCPNCGADMREEGLNEQ